MEEPVTKDVAKERFRNSRLQWSNQAVHKLRQELNDIALTKCRDITAQFAECAKASGYMVAFKCREHNKAMNECLHQYTNEEAFAVYRAKREQEVAEASAAELEKAAHHPHH